MTSHTVVSKITHKTTADSLQHSSGGENAVVITPPNYGVKFIDNGMEANAPVQCQSPDREIQKKPSPLFPAQSQPEPKLPQNNTGLPDTLKSGIESLSGLSMDNVKVHYNSSKPAQLNALAYAQGTDIHVSPGQEKHLPHEAWHVVQQKQGRVKPTMQMKEGVEVNDDKGLEREADVMGARAAAQQTSKSIETDAMDSSRTALQTATLGSESSANPVQRLIGFEFQCRNLSVVNSSDKSKYDPAKGPQNALMATDSYYLTSDGGDPEFVIEPPLAEDDAKGLNTVMTRVVKTASQLGKKDVRYIPKKKIDVTVTGREEPVTADPQATIGVGFHSLGELIDLLAQRDPFDKANDSNANKLLMQNKAVAHYKGDDLLLGKVKAEITHLVTSEIISDYPETPYFDVLFPTLIGQKAEVIGFLTLLASYAIKAPKAAYIKDFPLLSKSNLATAVASSPFGSGRLTQYQLEWMTNALSYGRKNFNEQMYNEKKIGSEDPKKDGPTVVEWITALFQSQKDLLSYTDNKDFADDSMGSMKRVDMVGPGRNLPAPILEFRRINDTLPVDQWIDFAEAIRSWIEVLNDPTQATQDF